MMAAESFLAKVVNKILEEKKENLQTVTIVLPNKRARLFLLKEFKNKLTTTVFSPTIISIEELIQKIAKLRATDSITVLFEFYEAYCSVTPKEEQQNFDNFSSWAKTAIQDFNEIDRYLIPPSHIFSYLSEIKALERWDVQPKKTTNLIDNHLEFWKKLPVYYHTLYNHLKDKKIGYQGLLYREATLQMTTFLKELQAATSFYFVGFNALNAAEEKIILHLVSENKATVFWDIDDYFMSNKYHDVGLFIRRIKNKWKPFYHKPFQWTHTSFQQKKNIEIIGTPKAIGQAKIAGKIVENLIASKKDINNIAVVLGDENLLLPTLNSLPEEVDSLNITMGYPSKNNPAQLLLSAIIKLHASALGRSKTDYVFYYKEVLSILNHPLIEPYANLQKIVQKIRNENFTFFSFTTLQQLKNNYDATPNTIFNLLFEPWVITMPDILEKLQKLLLYIKDNLNKAKEDEKINLAFVYAVYKSINKIVSFSEKYDYLNSVTDLQVIYKHIADFSEVSFEGEPLLGLQIMGVLESRLLDFKNVIITSVNEGKFPSAKSSPSFIPYDVKRELGLPTYKEKDAIYSYHFYHLLFRVENIYLLYNTDADGMNSGEKSRFIRQIEIEKLPNHSVKNYRYNAKLPTEAYKKMEIEKTELLQERLNVIATKKGFSPSSLTGYMRNPIQFYLQKILQIYETEDVEESIAVNTLGTIIHDSLEELYKPYIACFLTEKNIATMLLQIDEIVTVQFKKIYKEGSISKGKNYLAFEVAKRNIYNFLQQEKIAIQKGDAIKILHLENTLSCEIESEKLPFSVKITGKVDRVEQRNGTIRIIDYKTGKVEKSHLKIKEFNQLTADVKNEKSIQLLCYALMYDAQFSLPENGISAGVISFKNLRSGYLPFSVNGEETITQKELELFKKEIVVLIAEILNPKEKIKEI